jgi:hypothetical protein
MCGIAQTTARIQEEEREPWRENYQNAWAALRMIRETIETLGPPGALPSKEAVLMLYGPEPIHEGQAIVDALRKLLTTSDPLQA